MTATTETTATRTCPPSAVVDMILRWDEVREGDAVLHSGHLSPVEQWHLHVNRPDLYVTVRIDGLWSTVQRDWLTAVRRYSESSDDDALILAALDEAAADREYRASTACTDCTYTGDGPCPDQREHNERAAEYRAERDRREAGR
jgi:hypothetical protein